MKVLAISPHPDDAEFGVGGTLHKLSSYGNEVINLVFYNDPILLDECRKSSKILGVKPKFVYMQGRLYHEKRQEILQIFFDINKDLNPDMVFVPSTTDVHQDHKVVTEEAIRAFKESTVLGYNEPWNQTFIITNYFIILECDDTDAKLKALDKYNSRKSFPYFNEEYQKSLLRANGMKIKEFEAEAFEVIRVIERKI